jgi:hypothetical protein
MVTCVRCAPRLVLQVLKMSIQLQQLRGLDPFTSAALAADPGGGEGAGGLAGGWMGPGAGWSGMVGLPLGGAMLAPSVVAGANGSGAAPLGRTASDVANGVAADVAGQASATLAGSVGSVGGVAQVATGEGAERVLPELRGGATAAASGVLPAHGAGGLQQRARGRSGGRADWDGE